MRPSSLPVLHVALAVLAAGLLSSCGGAADCSAGCSTGETCSQTLGICVAGTGNGGTALCASSTDTWAGYASGFFATYCASCHGGNFSSASAVAASAGTISSNLSSGRMPRGVSLSSAERTRILNWLSCQ